MKCSRLGGLNGTKSGGSVPSDSARGKNDENGGGGGNGRISGRSFGRSALSAPCSIVFSGKSFIVI
jgi:hypothetical protein